MDRTDNGITRRALLESGLALTLFTKAGGVGFAGAQVPAAQPGPWYRRAYLWGQTNITEKDPVRYDIAWWRRQWKRTEVQAVIINAGGIVAYYPSRFPLHHRAEFLGDRDIFGELTRAAHDDGLFVMARMDSNRTAADFFEAHPDWFTRDATGQPYRAADKYITCINSPYYDEYLPGILREIIERSHPDGFTDNSWAGLGRASICYCDNCRRIAAHQRVLEHLATQPAAQPHQHGEAANEPHFSRGDIVKVKRYGRGIVEEASTLQVTVAFADGTRRCFQPEFVAPDRRARPAVRARVAAPAAPAA